MRDDGMTYQRIASSIGTTANSVKHKVRRLNQDANEDRYRHTKEKIEQIDRIIDRDIGYVLETHAGFGGLTNHYADLAKHEVLAMEIKGERCLALNKHGREIVHVAKCDSEHEILHHLYHRHEFDILDIDPYGMPSRYFPHALKLIRNGFLFVTFPIYGVAQMNKLTIEHLRVFWNITPADKHRYCDLVISRMIDFGFMTKREVTHLETMQIGRVFRVAFKITRKSLCELVGLVVKRRNEYQERHGDQFLLQFDNETGRLGQ